MRKIITLMVGFILVIAGCNDDEPSMEEVNYDLLGENYQDAVQNTIEENESGFIDTGSLTYFFVETHADSDITMSVEDTEFIIEIDEADTVGSVIPRIFEVDFGTTETIDVSRNDETEPIQMINMD